MDNFIQSDFSGGINLFNDDTGIAENEYVVGFNVRNRTSMLEYINDALIDSDAPEGLKQGCYAFDRYILLFCAGSAYYKDIILDTSWVKITGFSMDTTVNRIYTELIPQSTNNTTRVLVSAEKINGTQLVPSVNSTPNLITGGLAGLVVQDGINQPYLISSDASARVLNTYEQWTVSNREYVPIMKQMKFINGILTGVAPDGTTLYRSVSGRPLDFVVNVDINGNKGGDAKTTSYSVSPFPVTCLAGLNSGELFVGTLKTCHPVTFNYDSTIFAEPTFLNTKTMFVGVTNHFSFIDTIGDYTFIDIDGLRSFNAVNSDKDEGRTNIFSLKISKAFLNVINGRKIPLKQNVNVTAAIGFNNYSLYSITTVYGNVIGVFDNTRQVWCSFDRLTVDGQIKQFAIADQSDNPTVYAITDTSVYRLYDSTEVAEAEVRFLSKTSGLCSARLKCNMIWACFEGATTTSETVRTSISVDNKTPVEIEQPIGSDGSVDVITYNFQGSGNQGWKIQPIIKWQTNAIFNELEVNYNVVTSPVDYKQAGKAYG